jgi:hypothetical protein
MQLWWTTRVGAVETAFWYPNRWSRYEFAGPHRAVAGGGIAAVTRSPDHMELW